MISARGLHRRWWVWLLAVVLVLVGATAALGGLNEVEQQPQGRLEQGREVDWGAFRVTFGDAVSIPDPEEPTERLLVVAVDVHNHTDLFVSTTQVSEAVQISGDSGVVTDERGEIPSPDLRMRADNSDVEVFNPGLTYETALVWEQEPGWTGSEVTVGLQEVVWIEEDPLTLDDDRWARFPDVMYAGSFPVTVEGAP